MPKKAIPGKKPTITLDQNASLPLYKQLYERLRGEILTGQLEAGIRLPSTRALASELGISRNTTALAYELLLLEGYIESRVGDGTRVVDLPPEHFLQAPAGLKAGHKNRGMSGKSLPALAQRGQSLLEVSSPGELDAPPAGPGVRAFSSGQPDTTSFPYEIWTRLVTRHARQSLPGASFYQDVQGYAPLRESIASHIGITRGVHCTPEQIILTSGSQGALDLLARVLLDPGDSAWVEDPGYLGA
ncbi:MAG TPA: PLP-dependent aminotransferase family protein, partial [Ktedonobacteraceae bacterium]|nr:PLP-dependent aminotransferase family protein [Ktedonobacteraceae bacterium]